MMRTKTMKRTCLAGVILSGLGCTPAISPAVPAGQPPPASGSISSEPPQAPRDFARESEAERDTRMHWWRDAAFGMFVHWGPYAVPAGEYRGKIFLQPGEWLQAWANIPRGEYEIYARHFTAAKYDPTTWVKMAKDAGMKYLIVTSKHHDGFCIYDSAATDFDMVDATPFGKDALAPLAEECRRQGVRLGIYYSILDWHHPSQFPDPAGKDATNGHNKTKMREGQKVLYIAYMKKQLEELILRYDPEIFWFDGAWTEWWSESDGRELYNYLRAFKPSLLINNRIGKGRGASGMTLDGDYVGDFGTPEQKVPPTGLPGVDWESCMTMNDTWGYKTSDEKWKSSKELVRNLVDIASKRGNYLLNVGPDAEGIIPGAATERLRELGEWMRVNGESVYATSASPFAEELTWGRVTAKSFPGTTPDSVLTKLYLHVFHWPTAGKLEIPGLNNPVRRAFLLNDPQCKSLAFEARGQTWSIVIPGSPPDELVSVVVIELDGHPRRLTQASHQPMRRQAIAPITR